jgi:enoyl-CoA hydratase/carnithine racemase
MSLPVFATELARDRISKRHYTRATALGTIYGPEGACDAGFLDEVVEARRTVETAVEQAGALTGVGKAELAATRVSARSAVADTIRQSLDGDLGRFSIES